MLSSWPPKVVQGVLMCYFVETKLPNYFVPLDSFHFLAFYHSLQVQLLLDMYSMERTLPNCLFVKLFKSKLTWNILTQSKLTS